MRRARSRKVQLISRNDLHAHSRFCAGPLSLHDTIVGHLQGLPILPHPTTPLEAAAAGYTFYRAIQSHDGHFAGEYGGPLFLIPGLVIGLYVTGHTLRDEQRVEMARYVLRRMRSEGGWGL